VQQHLNGFRPGDPGLAPADPARAAEVGLPDRVDVLIVGSGPAGLVLAAQLARFPHLSTRVVERRGGPLQLGQADGVACRTVEMFEAFGLSDQLLRESCWITETVFWGQDPEAPDRVVRTGRVQDVEDGLSEFPHLVLNQARVQDLLLRSMRRSASRLQPDYGLELVDLTVEASGDHRIVATLREANPDRDGGGRPRTVRARYLVGCDGARSAVRGHIGGRLRGEAADHAWGVMDVLVDTDFPDIRRKALIKAEAGTLMVIPREGGYLCRMYVDMGVLGHDERVRDRQLRVEDLVEVARRILHPHTLEVEEVVWWSAYEVGQRLADAFDDVSVDGEDPVRDPHVFIAGDACHTHSPKAGQGMNVSMQDGFNLGWKLAAVLEGRSGPELLRTYTAERREVARELIDFDRGWASAMGATNDQETGGPTLQERFSVQGRYTAGVATRYRPGVLVGPQTWQHLATGFVVGERFHSAPVVRLCDAKPMHLGHVHEADGRWRIYAFGDRPDVRAADSRLRRLCAWLDTPDSPLTRFTPPGADADAVLDLRAVLQQGHDSIDPPELPPVLRPAKGRYGLRDPEKVFTAGPEDVFDLRGVDRAAGALVVVRPDQYVGHVLPLDGGAELAAYLGGFMRPAQ